MIAVEIVVALQIAFTYAPLFHLVFDTRPIDPTDMIVIVLAAIGLVVVLEAEKALRRSILTL